MARFEENKAVIDKTIEAKELKPSGTYQEMVVFQLGTIGTLLADISKSLAILADKVEREDMICRNTIRPTIVQADKQEGEK